MDAFYLKIDNKNKSGLSIASLAIITTYMLKKFKIYYILVLVV